jgi:hypothetical protein
MTSSSGGRGIALAVALVAGLLVVGGAAPSGAATADRSRAEAGSGPLDVLVLGDSYSAGNGATDDQGNAQTYGPANCYRSRVNWSEKYAAALRAAGQAVNLVNHACSGGVTADFTSPRAMDTASQIEPTPAGVTTSSQADASLAKTDPCNTGQFPDEEFWTYHATLVIPNGTTSYDCTRNLRPQSRFVTHDTDLVLFTNGGNDAGFTTIVTNCFVPFTRTASGCRTSVEAARALLPALQQRLVTGIDALRAHGLRDDAKIVQLGYPWLQTDNNFTLTDTTGTYDAGNQVRALVSQGNAAIAAVVPTVNAGHAGQATFLTGVPEKFSGHEPDATTLAGNPDRWLNQVGDGINTSLYYHPNRLGHTAYAELLIANGIFGASTPPNGKAKAKVRVHLTPRRLHLGQGSDRVQLRVKIKLSDGSRPQGTLVVRGLSGRSDLLGTLVTKQLRMKHHGTLHVTLRLRDPRIARLRIIYRDKAAGVVRVTRVVRGAH